MKSYFFFFFLLQGEAIMFAPKRGDTFDMFVSLAKDRFEIDVKENYDDRIWKLHFKVGL